MAPGIHRHDAQLRPQPSVVEHGGSPDSARAPQNAALSANATSRADARPLTHTHIAAHDADKTAQRAHTLSDEGIAEVGMNVQALHEQARGLQQQLAQLEMLIKQVDLARVHAPNAAPVQGEDEQHIQHDQHVSSPGHPTVMAERIQSAYPVNGIAAMVFGLALFCTGNPLGMVAGAALMMHGVNKIRNARYEVDHKPHRPHQNMHDIEDEPPHHHEPPGGYGGSVHAGPTRYPHFPAVRHPSYSPHPHQSAAARIAPAGSSLIGNLAAGAAMGAGVELGEDFMEQVF